MDVEDCNGRSYISASGDSSMEREFSGALGGPTVSTPNSKETSPSRSLSANSIKVELYSDEDPGRSTEDERGERVEEGGPEQGSEAVGVYREPTNPDIMPTGATRMPNGKLKCDICGMICIGPNVLMVHKRSHTVSSPTVGKPYKCSYCGRSYKQQSTLEEHRERCHSYLQSLESQQPSSAQNPGEEMRELEFIPDSLLQPSSDKMAFIDRLANSITKRKRSTPQKFVGQKHIRLNLADAPYELSTGLDKDREMHAGDLESPHFTGLGGEYAGVAGNGGGGVSDTLRPVHLSHPSCLSELRPIHSSIHTPVALGPRLDCTGTGAGLGAAGAGGREAAEGHEDLPAGRSHAPSPSNGCQDSTDTESMPDEPCNSTAPTLHSNNGHHLLHSNNHHTAPPPIAHHRSRDRHSPSHAKDREVEREDGGHSGALPPPALAATPSSPTAPSSTSREAFRVVDGEGRAVRSFRCEHCRVLFLDHVMFTIHMGCHGFRQPFECNICGHRSQDRYEFSSHIVRGEHILD
ncbi:zinc finger protein Eos isoform X3 [Dicentrarchus labrax]|uniref:zinc finger protein Eos isoform X3 n=1 Tax=Dicentrarchus labrax TaxID=13489 RepID=UPI0021F5227F|nr:zinc finger protein Eos isoform X3 [Dicentrarchus labrax]